MTITNIKQIIEQNKDNIAFVVGNGINRYPNNPNALSWDELLIKLCSKVSSQTLTGRPNGISLTEFYDILELEKPQNIKLQREVTKLMENWEPQNHHRIITDRIKELNAPILTTNFEETFAKTFKYKLLRTEQEGFTDFYPWTTYHGENQLKLPTDGFGVWYINGMINYHRSIRLGLSHYMGSVERARYLLRNERSLFSSKDVNNWEGCKTWLHIVFNKSLFVFGLGLEENEIFLRWLLIERIKYLKYILKKHKKHISKEHKGWYINKRSNNGTDQGKKLFLEHVGFEVIEVDDYADIYEHIWR